MDNEIVPFGKYEGRSYASMLEDAKYMAWVKKQDWFLFAKKIIEMQNEKNKIGVQSTGNVS